MAGISEVSTFIGGKYSTVLAYVLSLLNQKHDYGLDLLLLSIDEGIAGYRDDSLDTVKRNEQQYNIPLTIVSYKQLYGWTMDEIVKQIGTKNNCTFCGVFRRQALDRGAYLLKATKVATGRLLQALMPTGMPLNKNQLRSAKAAFSILHLCNPKNTA